MASISHSRAAIPNLHNLFFAFFAVVGRMVPQAYCSGGGGGPATTTSGPQFASEKLTTERDIHLSRETVSYYPISGP